MYSSEVSINKYMKKSVMQTVCNETNFVPK